MTGFRDLPRELRHMILKPVFEDAVAKDIRLNEILYTFWLSVYSEKDQSHSHWTILAYIEQETCSEVSYSQHPAPDNYWAPSIHQTIAILIAVAPDLAEDSIFVGGLALSAFENAVDGFASYEP